VASIGETDLWGSGNFSPKSDLGIPILQMLFSFLRLLYIKDRMPGPITPEEKVKSSLGWPRTPSRTKQADGGRHPQLVGWELSGNGFGQRVAESSI
jgi:hypothetical protein